MERRRSTGPSARTINNCWINSSKRARMCKPPIATGSPRYLACQNGSAATIEKLLAAGADANAAVTEGETALMTASRTGNPDAVKILLDHGAAVNAKESWHGETALMWAAAEGHPEAVKMLIEHGASVDADRTRTNGLGKRLLSRARSGCRWGA